MFFKKYLIAVSIFYVFWGRLVFGGVPKLSYTALPDAVKAAVELKKFKDIPVTTEQIVLDNIIYPGESVEIG